MRRHPMNTSLFGEMNATRQATETLKQTTSPDVACVGRPAVGLLCNPRRVQTIPTLGIGVNEAKKVNIGDGNDQVI